MTTSAHKTNFAGSNRIFVNAKKKEDRINNNSNSNVTAVNNSRNSNNNSKLFYSSKVGKNMFEALEKSCPVFPSFLTLEPIPEFKIFDAKTSFTPKPVSIGLQKPTPTSTSKVAEKSEPEAGKASSSCSRTSSSVDNCDSNGSSSFDGLMPPPPPANFVKMSDALKAKAAKKKLPVSGGGGGGAGAVIQKPAKVKRFSCPDCDLGVTFKSKIELQHHQSALHTAVVCRFCRLAVNGLVKLRRHFQTAHPMKKSVQREEREAAAAASNPVRCQTYHVCGQCDYKTNQGSNLIRHRESLHAYYTCAYCQPQVEVILGKKQLSDHLKRVHKLRINLRTYFEDEKRISSVVKRGAVTPKLKCDRCSFVTENLTVWTKHDCNIVKIEKPTAATTAAASSLSTSDQTSVGSSSIDQDDDDDDASNRSSSPDDCFSQSDRNALFDAMSGGDVDVDDDDDDGAASRSDLDSCSEFNGRNSADGTESGFGDENSESQISVPDFSAVNEFFEFRLYDSVSAAHMNRIWDEAIEAVNRKSAVAPAAAHHHLHCGGGNGGGFVVLARPVNDQLALWEM